MSESQTRQREAYTYSTRIPTLQRSQRMREFSLFDFIPITRIPENGIEECPGCQLSAQFLFSTSTIFLSPWPPNDRRTTSILCSRLKQISRSKSSPNATYVLRSGGGRPDLAAPYVPCVFSLVLVYLTLIFHNNTTLRFVDLGTLRLSISP